MNSVNAIVAKFSDDTRTLLTGPTTILDDLYCSGTIDGYLFTPTEIKPRDTNPLLIKNSLGATAIEINATEVDKKTIKNKLYFKQFKCQ